MTSYNQWLLKRADENEAAAADRQERISQYLADDDKRKGMGMSSAEPILYAGGAGLGGLAGWALAKLIHKKPTSKIKLLYTMAGAGLGLGGTAAVLHSKAFTPKGFKYSLKDYLRGSDLKNSELYSDKENTALVDYVRARQNGKDGEARELYEKLPEGLKAEVDAVVGKPDEPFYKSPYMPTPIETVSAVSGATGGYFANKAIRRGLAHGTSAMDNVRQTLSNARQHLANLKSTGTTGKPLQQAQQAVERAQANYDSMHRKVYRGEIDKANGGLHGWRSAVGNVTQGVLTAAGMAPYVLGVRERRAIASGKTIDPARIDAFLANR